MLKMRREIAREGDEILRSGLVILDGEVLRWTLRPEARRLRAIRKIGWRR